MSSNPLDEYDEAVLREIAGADRGSDQTGLFRAKSDLEKEFDEEPHRLGVAIENLEKRGYAKDIKAILATIGDTSIDYDAYQITALGKNYLARLSGNSTNYTVGGHANIAHNSPGAAQSIDINNLDEDLMQKLAELQDAVEKKDSSAIKKAFGYIADKSVDVAIALITQGIAK